MEFMLVHGGSRGHSLRYELLWDGGDHDTRRLCGLIDTDKLSEPTELQSTPLRPAQVGVQAAQVGAKLAPSCPQVGVKLEALNRPQTRANAGDTADQRVNGSKPHNKAPAASSLAAVVAAAH
jgi:hypothetical protein